VALLFLLSYSQNLLIYYYLLSVSHIGLRADRLYLLQKVSFVNPLFDLSTFLVSIDHIGDGLFPEVPV